MMPLRMLSCAPFSLAVSSWSPSTWEPRPDTLHCDKPPSQHCHPFCPVSTWPSNGRASRSTPAPDDSRGVTQAACTKKWLYVVFLEDTAQEIIGAFGHGL